MGVRTFLTVGAIPVLGFGNLLLGFICGKGDFWRPRSQAGSGQDRGEDTETSKELVHPALVTTSSGQALAGTARGLQKFMFPKEALESSVGFSRGG